MKDIEVLDKYTVVLEKEGEAYNIYWESREERKFVERVYRENGRVIHRLLDEDGDECFSEDLGDKKDLGAVAKKIALLLTVKDMKILKGLNGVILN